MAIVGYKTGSFNKSPLIIALILAFETSMERQKASRKRRENATWRNQVVI